MSLLVSMKHQCFKKLDNCTVIKHYDRDEMQMCYCNSHSVAMCAVSMKGGGWFSLPGLLTDLQLSLNASLAALPVVRLGGVVL